MPGLAMTRIAVALFGVALLASSCATAPAPPLLSPLAVAKDYGYSETATGDGRYQVTFVAPPQRTGRSIDMRAETTAALRKQAFDLATWRAAQLALAHGDAGFKIGNTNSNVNNYADEAAYLPPPWWGAGGFRRGYFDGGLGPYWEESPFVLVQLDLTIDVVLEKAPAAGDYNAAQLIDQLRRTYPGADAAAPASTPAPASG
jgi:hypothetical protein